MRSVSGSGRTEVALDARWRQHRPAANLSEMGGPSQADARAPRWAWLAGAICIIAPACSSTEAVRTELGAAGSGAVGGSAVASAGTGAVASAGTGAVTSAGAGRGGAPASSLEAPPACSDQASFDGTYRVPVSTDLEPYASFPVSGIEFCEQNGSVRLSYELPELLLGASQKIRFEGTYDASAPSIELTGERGSASCTSNGGVWSCRETLTGVEVDADKVAKLLAALPPAEAQARGAVSDVFTQDPIGVLSFDTPDVGSPSAFLRGAKGNLPAGACEDPPTWPISLKRFCYRVALARSSPSRCWPRRA
jgi:hypothetical protein